MNFSEYDNYEKLIKTFDDICKNKKIQFVEPIYPYYCLESFPCQGHGGMKIHFNNYDTIDFYCSSVEIAILMHYLDVEKINDAHFAIYLDKNIKTKINKLKNKKKEIIT